MIIQGNLQRMMGMLEIIARGIPQRLARAEVPPPQVPKQHHSVGEFVADHLDSMGQTPYILLHELVEIPTLMVPPAKVIHESVLAVDDE